MIPCITLYQPWASLIADGYKTIETRTHDRFKCLVGRYIGIHAGGKYDEDGFYAQDDARLAFIPLKYYDDNLPHSSIICTAYVEAHRLLETETDYIAACLEPEDPRDNPRYGLFLSDIQPVEPIIECTGKQGIWYHAGIQSPLDAQLNLEL